MLQILRLTNPVAYTLFICCLLFPEQTFSQKPKPYKSPLSKTKDSKKVKRKKHSKTASEHLLGYQLLLEAGPQLTLQENFQNINAPHFTGGISTGVRYKSAFLGIKADLDSYDSLLVVPFMGTLRFGLSDEKEEGEPPQNDPSSFIFLDAGYGKSFDQGKRTIRQGATLQAGFGFFKMRGQKDTRLSITFAYKRQFFKDNPDFLILDHQDSINIKIGVLWMPLR